MKIYQINASYKPAYIYGGPALSISRLCEGLARAGADIEVLTTTANGKEELNVPINIPQIIDGVKVSYFKRLTKDHTHFSPDLLTALNTRLRRNNAIVHIHVWWNLVSVFSCFIAKLRKVPVVLTPRGTLSLYSFGNRNAGIKGAIHSLLGKSLLNYCHLHVTSAKEKEDLLRVVKPKSITIIPNFIYLPPLNTSDLSKRSNETYKLLFLSRIEEKKGLDILFNALSEFIIPFELTIAGTGESSYIIHLKTLAQHLNISHFIKWVGQQSQEEKWGVIQQHDLLVLPSYDENFANVVIESLAVGTPVLITEKVGLFDYIVKNDFGWVCKPEISSLREALVNFTKQSEKANNIRQLAPQKIREDFDEKKLVQQFLKMYSEIAR